MFSPPSRRACDGRDLPGDDRADAVAGLRRRRARAAAVRRHRRSAGVPPGTADHVSGLAAGGRPPDDHPGRAGARLPPSPGIAVCVPGPAGTPALRSGLNPDPPIGGAGPYYLAQGRQAPRGVPEESQLPRAASATVRRHRCQGRGRSRPLRSTRSERGHSMPRCSTPATPISGAASVIARAWGPGSAHAAEGDQRWFGGPRPGVDYIALNATRPAFRDLDVRRAVALALDRAAISSIWVTGRARPCLCRASRALPSPSRAGHPTSTLLGP